MFKYQKKINYQPRMPHLVKISFRNKGKIKKFSEI